MGILMKAFVCLSLLLFCSFINAKASARELFLIIPGTGSPGPLAAPIVHHQCSVFKRCSRPPGVGKQVVDNKPAKKSVIAPQGRGGYNGGQP